jgi:hypothetical protein
MESESNSSEITDPEARTLDRHHSDFLLHLSRIDHRDRVPRTAIQKTPIRPFADAFFAADAQNGIHLDPSKGRIIFVRYPEHAIFDRAIFHARRGAGAPGAALGYNRKFFRFLFAGCGETFGLRFKLQLVRNHPDGLGSSRCSRHAGIIAENCPYYRLEIPSLLVSTATIALRSASSDARDSAAAYGLVEENLA